MIVLSPILSAWPRAARVSLAKIKTVSVFAVVFIENAPLKLPVEWFNNDKGLERGYAASAWKKVREAAERHYEPGLFTTFAGFEYSPVLPDRGKHHRNVIFRSMATHQYAVSAVEAPSEFDLWQQLERHCTGDCAFLTIPHNSNKSWGLAFASKTIDGIPYTEADWRCGKSTSRWSKCSRSRAAQSVLSPLGRETRNVALSSFSPPAPRGRRHRAFILPPWCATVYARAWCWRTSWGSTRYSSG
ncbi:MAG: DUF3604 domain-containing protein [OM182 bacterium]|nr:MAG: DUF3604 domain-containing protein [OM182 bacterium]